MDAWPLTSGPHGEWTQGEFTQGDMTMATKTTCSATRAELLAAKPLVMELRDHEGNIVFKTYLPVRAFSTDSVGYNANGKAEICMGSKYVTCQVGANITVIGSKELPKG
jgi:hypothetical protein